MTGNCQSNPRTDDISTQLLCPLIENLSILKGHAWKLSPKFIGPYKVLKDYKNYSYKLDLSTKLKQQGIHPAFHMLLFCVHVPHNNRCFPERQLSQITRVGHIAK